MVEPGIRAGRLTLGMGSWHKDSTAIGPGFGYMLRATMLRRWAGSVDYAGVELSMPLVGPRVGVFKPLKSNPREKVRVTIDLSVGW